MSSTKHTPGKWEVWKTASGRWTVRSVYFDDQGRRCTAWPAVCDAAAQDNEANARLIAAAPKLQEENERLRAELDEATVYMRNLLTTFVGEHFPDNDGWKPLGDLVGMMTQIDNALTIASEYKARLAEALKALREREPVE